MQLQHPMRTVTASLDGEVLEVLAGASEAAFTVSRIERLLVDRSRSGIRLSLDRLAEQGVVDARDVGRTAEYRFNSDHLAAPAIVQLARLRDELMRRTRQELESWSPVPVYAALFGSAARGRMRADSDLDLFVVRPDHVDLEVWEDQCAELEHHATRWTGNDARILQMTKTQVGDGATSDPVLGSIVDEGVTVLGDSAWIARLVRGRRKEHA